MDFESFQSFTTPTVGTFLSQPRFVSGHFGSEIDVPYVWPSVNDLSLGTGHSILNPLPYSLLPNGLDIFESLPSASSSSSASSPGSSTATASSSTSSPFRSSKEISLREALFGLQQQPATDHFVFPDPMVMTVHEASAPTATTPLDGPSRASSAGPVRDQHRSKVKPTPSSNYPVDADGFWHCPIDKKCPLISAKNGKPTFERHLRKHSPEKKWICICCMKSLSRADALKRHLKGSSKEAAKCRMSYSRYGLDVFDEGSLTVVDVMKLIWREMGMVHWTESEGR